MQKPNWKDVAKGLEEASPYHKDGWTPSTPEERQWFSRKVALLIREGKPRDQAVAIAYSIGEGEFAKGGPGSGNHGHSGRPGQRGGSSHGPGNPPPGTNPGHHDILVGSGFKHVGSDAGHNQFYQHASGATATHHSGSGETKVFHADKKPHFKFGSTYSASDVAHKLGVHSTKPGAAGVIGGGGPMSQGYHDRK